MKPRSRPSSRTRRPPDDGAGGRPGVTRRAMARANSRFAPASQMNRSRYPPWDAAAAEHGAGRAGQVEAQTYQRLKAWALRSAGTRSVMTAAIAGRYRSNVTPTSSTATAVAQVGVGDQGQPGTRILRSQHRRPRTVRRCRASQR